MRGRYETELQRLRTENTRNAARAERLAKEIERKKAITQDLRDRRHRYKLRRLLFGHAAGKHEK